MAHPTFSSSAPAGADRSTFPNDRKRPFAQPTATLDPEQVLAELRTIISHGSWNLGAVLQSIAQAAQIVTCANGAAIALRRDDDAVICQARVGDMAPALGTKLDMDSGISGQCLRTGWTLRCDDTHNDPRVDAEVCRGLGLRSLAVVAVGRKPPLSGILEAFSTLPYAFRNSQVELLEELAELVSAAQRRSAESDAPTDSEKLSRVPTSAWLETTRSLRRQAMDRAKLFFAQTPQSWSKRKLIAAAVAMVALLSWLVFRGKPGASDQTAASPQALTGPQAAAVPDASFADAPVIGASPAVPFKPDTARAVPAQDVKASVSSRVVMASKTEKASTDQDVFVRNATPEPASNLDAGANAAASITIPSPQEDNTSDDAPALAAESASSGRALRAVLSAPSSLPEPSLPVSKGLTEGILVRKVDPIYPPMARTMRLEGSVILEATVSEDGAVRDVKVISGSPVLAHAAQQAVGRWLYRPFLLNGKPVAMRTEITVDFKLP